MMREYHTSSLDEVLCGDHHVSQRPVDEDRLFCACSALSASCSEQGQKEGWVWCYRGQIIATLKLSFPMFNKGMKIYLFVQAFIQLPSLIKIT